MYILTCEDTITPVPSDIQSYSDVQMIWLVAGIYQLFGHTL